LHHTGSGEDEIKCDIAMRIATLLGEGEKEERKREKD